MYDDLVRRLRSQCQGYGRECEDCEANGNCRSQMENEAADSIEFLQTYKVAFENIISMGGWWLVGQDKNLHRMNVPMDWPPEGAKTVEVFPLPEPPKEEL